MLKMIERERERERWTWKLGATVHTMEQNSSIKFNFTQTDNWKGEISHKCLEQIVLSQK